MDNKKIFECYINFRKKKNSEESELLKKQKKEELKLYKRFKKNFGYLTELQKIISKYNLNISLNMTFKKFKNNNSLYNEGFNFNTFFSDFRKVEVELINNYKIKEAFNELNQVLKSLGYEYDPELNYSNFSEGKINFYSLKHKDVLSVKSDKPNGTIVKLVFGGIIDRKKNEFIYKSEVYVSLNL